VREALDVGTELVAVACPTCLINLKEGANAWARKGKSTT
jgi:Fe-S oxidoreductase